MLLVAYFTCLLLFCRQTDAATTKFTFKPSNQEIAIEARDFTLMWNYTLGGSILVAKIGNVTGVGNTEQIARRELNGPTNVLGNYQLQGRFSANISDTHAWLKIRQVQRSDQGKYNFDLDASGSGDLNHEVEVIVHFPPRLFNNVTAVDQLVKKGSDLKLYCKASGNPDPNIAWIRLFDNGSESEVLHTDDTWNIISINQTDAGKYRCTAKNGVGNPVNHTISVNVLYRPKIFDFVQEYNVTLQQRVVLYCQAKGFPRPSFKWSPCQGVCDNGTLFVPAVLNGTDYTCTVTNSEGSDSAIVSVVIAGEVINITMTVTSESCTDGKYNATFLSKKVSDTMKVVFANEGAYVGTTITDVRCGSLIVDLALRFSAIVTEKHILAVLKGAVKDGKLGELSVEASSIKGTRPVIRATTSSDDGKTTTKPPDDDKTTIIVAVVVSVAVVAAIVVGVVLWRLWKKKQDRKKVNKEVGVKNTGDRKMKQMGGRSSDGYENTGSSSASPEKAAEMTYSVVEQDKGNSMSRTSGGGPKKPPRSFEAETRQQSVDGRNKSKKAKKEQAQEKPVGVVYAQVDKTKKKPKKPEATYDQAERPGSKGPGDLTYAMLEHGQGSSMPRNAASQVRKPKPYVETEYAMIV